ncbi:MAG TPA: GGDEF domain-containing protein [Caulobacteraceae bacterium]|nr:GGDEF domain-containing protein [Caulobacteraceae bacterium]
MADRARHPTPPEAPAAEAARLRAEVAALKAEVERLKALADHDTLTPVLNRRAFVRELSRAMASSRRYGTPAALLYLDLDGFKGVNDGFGHAAGDMALKRVAELLVANLREEDVVGRMGGDEFAVLLQRADLDAARAKAQALATLLEGDLFEWEGERVRLGGSFGVRAFAGQPDAEAWLAEADAAMFVRKRGR